MKRLVCAGGALLVVVVVVARLGRVQAQVSSAFAITSLDCASVPGHIRVTNTATPAALLGSPPTPPFLQVVITSAAGASTTLPVDSAIAPPSPPAHQVSGGATIDLEVGPGAAQSPPSAPPTLLDGSVIALSTVQLLLPGSTVQLSDGSTTFGTLQTCPAAAVLSHTLTVSTFGFDLLSASVPNAVCGPDLPTGVLPTAALPGPCLTIQHALVYARDGDTIAVEAGIYEVCSPIEVSKLVRITANGNKVILHSLPGTTVFHVTAVGAGVGPANLATHAAIDGFAIGGAVQPAAAAIVLDGDAFTDVTNNVLGGETLTNPAFTGSPCPPAGAPLPSGFTAPTPVQKAELFGNAAGIILANSDHPNIANNAILGSAIFAFSPVLASGDVRTGFGIVTAECLGLEPDASDGVTLSQNLIDRNVNAAVWLCSDGGGLHQLKGNTVRNNGRGVVLRGIADSLLDANLISDDYQDAVVVYDASENNTISNNTIESSRTPGAAGIRLGGFGAGLHPLATTVTGNKLLRNWIGLVIAGARNTVATGNTITAEDLRTAVLLALGSAGDLTTTQPAGTQLHQNTLVYNGGCAAQTGCAIRLDAGVTVDVDASGNSFGLPPQADVNAVLWHKPNDPALGFIHAEQAAAPQTAPAPASGGSSSAPAPNAQPVEPASTPTPAAPPPICQRPDVPPGCISP